MLRITVCALAFFAQGALTVQAQESWEKTLSFQTVAPAKQLQPRFRPKRPVAAMNPLDCTTLAIVTEAANQPFRGQALVGYTAKRRAELTGRGFGGSSICKVVYAKLPDGSPQYDGVHKGFVGSRNSPAWKRARLAAIEVLNGYYPGDHWANATYYLHPKLSGQRSWCWFKRNLVVIGKYGDHEFYREPETVEDFKRITHDLPTTCGGKAVYAQR